MNVVRAVIAAAAQPTAAKLADVFGRVEVVFVSVAFYVVGMAALWDPGGLMEVD